MCERVMHVHSLVCGIESGRRFGALAERYSFSVLRLSGTDFHARVVHGFRTTPIWCFTTTALDSIKKFACNEGRQMCSHLAPIRCMQRPNSTSP